MNLVVSKKAVKDNIEKLCERDLRWVIKTLVGGGHYTLVNEPSPDDEILNKVVDNL